MPDADVRFPRFDGHLESPTRYAATAPPLTRHAGPVSANLLNQEFGATAVNRKWAAHSTYIARREGWLYLAAVLDLCSRWVVGWAMRPTLAGELVSAVLRMAVQQRRPTGSDLPIQAVDRQVDMAQVGGWREHGRSRCCLCCAGVIASQESGTATNRP